MPSAKIQKTDAETFKYFSETFDLGWDFTDRLQAGQLVSTATVYAEDQEGRDVTLQIFTSSVAQVTTGQIASATLRQNGGVIGKTYYLLYMAVCTSPAATLAQSLSLEIR